MTTRSFELINGYCDVFVAIWNSRTKASKINDSDVKVLVFSSADRIYLVPKFVIDSEWGLSLVKSETDTLAKYCNQTIPDQQYGLFFTKDIYTYAPLHTCNVFFRVTEEWLKDCDFAVSISHEFIGRQGNGALVVD